MRDVTLKAILLGCSSLMAAGSVGSAANAVPNGETELNGMPSNMEEIIVTARKRKENASLSPVAVTAFDEKEIADSGIVDLQDIALFTPGFSYREGFGRLFSEGNNRPAIRGMSSILGEANAGYFIDGVYIAGPISSFDLSNLSRVEVVRGPQSALFGRGAFGGAINFVTRRPSDEIEGRAEFTAGLYGLASFNAFVSGPIGDTVSAEINARMYRRGSQYENAATNEKDLGGQESMRIGGKLDIQATDNLNIYLHGGWARDKDEGYAFAMWNGGDPREEGSSPNQSNCFRPNIVASFFGMDIADRHSRGYYCGEISQPDTYYSDYGGLDSVDRNIVNVIADITYTLGNGATFTSLTGYTNVQYSQAELPAISPGGSVVWEKGSQNYFSEEIRFASRRDTPFRMMAGGYYFRSNTGDTVNTSFIPSNGQTLADKDTALLSNGSYIENKALFAAFDYDVWSQLTVTGEVRYQEEQKHLEGALYDGAANVSYDAWLPRFAVTYKASDALTVYANIAKGNKPGGFNDDFYELALDADDRNYWNSLGRGTYDESSVWSYEAGIKASADDTFTINASLFYLDWSAQQLTQSDALLKAGSTRQTTVTFITNAGKSKVKGFELDASFEVSQGLNMHVAYAYSDAVFKDYVDENWRDLNDTNGWYTGQALATLIFPDGDTSLEPSLLPEGVVLDATRPGLDTDGDGEADRYFVIDTVDISGQVKGNNLPQTPRHQISYTITYEKEVANDITGFIRADYLYESKRYVQAVNLSWVGSTNKANLRAGIRSGNWTLTAWVDNITKEKTPEVVTRYPDFQNAYFIPSQVRTGNRYTFNRDFAVTAPAIRTAGLSLDYRF